MTKSRIGLACWLVFAGWNPAYALEYAAGASAAITQMKISGEKFRPVVATLELAANHRKSGVGFELHLGQGVSEDDAAGIEMEVLQQHSAYLTFTSEYEGKYRVWLGAGYTQLELDSQNAAGFPGEQEFEGTSFTFTAQEYYFANVPNLSLIGSYRQIFKDDNLDVRALSLGVRYDF